MPFLEVNGTRLEFGFSPVALRLDSEIVTVGGKEKVLRNFAPTTIVSSKIFSTSSAMEQWSNMRFRLLWQLETLGQATGTEAETIGAKGTNVMVQSEERRAICL
jgi:hypothetical protein